VLALSPGAHLTSFVVISMMQAKHAPPTAWLVAFKWTLATLAGWAIGLAGGALVTLAAARLPGVNEDRLFAYAMLASAGLAIGALQWRVMARHLPRPAHWLAATLIGCLVSLAVFAAANLAQLAARPWADAALLGLIGAAIGGCQWLVLRRHYRRAGMWVLASAAGSLCFVWLTTHPVSSLGDLVVLGALLGGAGSIAPGIVLAWLVRLHAP
jgi:hypothetical protein